MRDAIRRCDIYNHNVLETVNRWIIIQFKYIICFNSFASLDLFPAIKSCCVTQLYYMNPDIKKIKDNLNSNCYWAGAPFRDAYARRNNWLHCSISFIFLAHTYRISSTSVFNQGYQHQGLLWFQPEKSMTLSKTTHC